MIDKLLNWTAILFALFIFGLAICFRIISVGYKETPSTIDPQIMSENLRRSLVGECADMLSRECIRKTGKPKVCGDSAESKYINKCERILSEIS